MNPSRPGELSVWRGAIIGASLFFVSAVLLHLYALTNPPSVIWLVVTFGLAGAIVGHLGMKHSAGVMGASLGLALGLLAGAIAGDEVGIYLQVDEPQGAKAGQVVEIEGTTLDGQLFDLKDWRGKVVLVDFWATWCPPCVAEVPNVKQVYERYHKDGFEIVGVSLDEYPEKLSEFVKRREMPWPQIISENPNERIWSNPMARKYGISSVPTMYLVDKEGKLALSLSKREDLGPTVERLLADADVDVHIGLFPMGLLLGACAGAFVGIYLGDFCERLVRGKPRPDQIV